MAVHIPHNLSQDFLEITNAIVEYNEVSDQYILPSEGAIKYHDSSGTILPPNLNLSLMDCP